MAPVLGAHDGSGLPEGRWIGSFSLALGGQGSVRYWVKVDQNQNILDRMVIKDLWSTKSTQEPEAYQGIYEDLVRKGLDFGVAASGKPGKAKPDERFFREAYVQGLMTDTSSPASATTVPLRGFKRVYHPNDSKGSHWRLYMDYLHTGDLQDLINFHDGKEPIPEAFIWWVFTCLANALVQMEDRVRTRAGARPEQDETIAMIDMKPPNMLLDHRRGSQYPVYPKPLISDFGSAHITHEADPRNVKGGFSQTCTVGFWAPEMTKWDYQFGRPRQGIEKPLYSWTNIWQAGRVIECMMCLTDMVSDDIWGPSPVDSNVKDYPFMTIGFPSFRYSDDLIDLVWQCQRGDPEERPTPRQLLNLIQQRAPRHNSNMDEWGTAAWVTQQEAAPPTRTYAQVANKIESIKARKKAGKLSFVDNYPDPGLAERCRQLDMDIPQGCELAFKGKPDRAKIGHRAPTSAPPEEPHAGVKW